MEGVQAGESTLLSPTCFHISFLKPPCYPALSIRNSPLNKSTVVSTMSTLPSTLCQGKDSELFLWARSGHWWTPDPKAAKHTKGQDPRIKNTHKKGRHYKWIHKWAICWCHYSHTVKYLIQMFKKIEENIKNFYREMKSTKTNWKSEKLNVK